MTREIVRNNIFSAGALFFLLGISFVSYGQQDARVEKYASTITASDLSDYLHVIASDSMEGRETGEAGQKKAADYIVGKFKEFGLKPVVKEGNGLSYLQKFSLEKKQWDEVYLIVNDKKKKFLEDFYVYGDVEFPAEEKTEIVFAGYGIDAESYSDYKNISSKKPIISVKGKSVIIFPGDPVIAGISAVTGEKSLSSWANDWRKKAATAKEQGAKNVFIVVGNKDEDFYNRLNQLKEHISQSTLGFTHKQRPGSAVFIPVSLAAEMLNLKPEKLIEEKDKRTVALKSGSKYSAIKKTAIVSIKVSVKKTAINTENILGLIEGTDKKDEIVVLTAHYDHIGKEGDKIYYGADDDGSGTVALLEIAQAFSKAVKDGIRPRRSILIMPVTAEEKGLMGSEYYTDKPVFPLANTVADLNIDMIGRLDEAHATNENYVYIIGSNRLSTGLHKISEEANKKSVNIELDYKFNSFDDPNRFYFRSDHYNFAKNKIPVIFYFSGVHADYHKPTDTVDKILFEKAAKITKLVFYTAWELANSEERIKVDVEEK